MLSCGNLVTLEKAASVETPIIIIVTVIMSFTDNSFEQQYQMLHGCKRPRHVALGNFEVKARATIFSLVDCAFLKVLFILWTD